MSLPRENRFDEIAPLLPKVEKPARYLGHEWGSTEPDEDAFHVCMVFPDVYEIGVPNLGVAILYRALNRTPGLSCERCYLPWPDMADAMRAAGVPMLSLESASPVASFGMVGVSIAHELAGTNVVEALDLARVPVRACDRAEDDAIVVAGGPGIWNPEPLAPMFDAFLLGEGEEHIVEVAEAVKAGREGGGSPPPNGGPPGLGGPPRGSAHRHCRQLVDGRGGVVVVYHYLIQLRGVRPACPDGGILFLQVPDGFFHFAFRFREYIFHLCHDFPSFLSVGLPILVCRRPKPALKNFFEKSSSLSAPGARLVRDGPRKPQPLCGGKFPLLSPAS